MANADITQELEGLSIEDTEKPFHIVLIDIKLALGEGKISCTKVPFMPVDDGSLDYVAISYRWGELPETTLNTGVDYLSSIKSFDMYDFFTLFYTIAEDPSMCHIKYVWVDAICVNQTNYEQRKATIHHMSKIYERATHILAVPDLHLSYLKKSTIIKPFTEHLEEYGQYIYHLLHGNVESFVQLDLDLFNDLLHRFGNPKWILTFDKTTPDELVDPDDRSKAIQIWKDRLVERNRQLPKCIDFLMDLIRDWATRVWVVSEYHIAKNSKQKLKYWFIQLYHNARDGPLTVFEFDFSKPTLPRPPEFRLDGLPGFAKETLSFAQSIHNVRHFHWKFHTSMVEYLVDQCFFEMMLKANASKNEDRFYAVLPHSEKYKHHLQSKSSVVSWNINTTASVVLQLFDLMDTVDKLGLFYLLYREDPVAYTVGLPTFTTAAIAWDCMWFYRTILEQVTDPTKRVFWNFDEEAPLTLLRPDNSTQDGLYKLELRPKEFYWNNNSKVNDFIFDLRWRDSTAFQQLGLSDPSVVIDVVSIPFYVDTCEKKDDKMGYLSVHSIRLEVCNATSAAVQLIGSFEENKWILAPKYICLPTLFSDDWKLCRCSSDDNSMASNFYIY